MERQASVGRLLRDWRQRRRMSQLELAIEAEVSTRHLSFVETGRARPSRSLLLHLGDVLELPLRERNRMLAAGGFSPEYPEHHLSEPALASALDAVRRLLDAHDPYPALAVDRHWNLLLANPAAQRLMQGVAPELLHPRPNVLRLTLHPNGLASAIIDLDTWRSHLMARLRRLLAQTDDPELAALHDELLTYRQLPGEAPTDTGPPKTGSDPLASPHPDIVLPLRLRSPVGELALFATITVFGTPTDITLSELAIESFFPADPETAERLRQLAR